MVKFRKGCNWKEWEWLVSWCAVTKTFVRVGRENDGKYGKRGWREG